MLDSESVERVKTITTRFLGRTHMNNYLAGYKFAVERRKLDNYRYAHIELQIATCETIISVEFQVKLSGSKMVAHRTAKEMADMLREIEERDNFTPKLYDKSKVSRIAVGDDVVNSMSIAGLVNN